MASDTKNVKLGVCSVTFAGVDLGYTKGGVEVEVTTETKKVMVDQFGNSPINEIIMGRSCTAKVPLAETTLRNLVRIMPGATLVTEGGAKATGSVTFATTAPVNNDSVTVNGLTWTFKTAPAAGNAQELAIPASVNAAATAIANAINSSVDPRVAELSASANLGVVTINADDEGASANAVTLARVGTNITVSGATMTGGTDPSKMKVDVQNGVGLSLLENAQKLILHPQGLVASNRTEDFTIPLANTGGGLAFAYKLDEERIFNVEFSAYPDPVTKKLFTVGDETAVES